MNTSRLMKYRLPLDGKVRRVRRVACKRETCELPLCIARGAASFLKNE